MDAWVWGVAALGLGGGVLLFRRWQQRRGDHLLDAMRASKYGFGGVAAPWDYERASPMKHGEDKVD